MAESSLFENFIYATAPAFLTGIAVGIVAKMMNYNVDINSFPASLRDLKTLIYNLPSLIYPADSVIGPGILMGTGSNLVLKEKGIISSALQATFTSPATIPGFYLGQSLADLINN